MALHKDTSKASSICIALLEQLMQDDPENFPAYQRGSLQMTNLLDHSPRLLKIHYIVGNRFVAITYCPNGKQPSYQITSYLEEGNKITRMVDSQVYPKIE